MEVCQCVSKRINKLEYYFLVKKLLKVDENGCEKNQNNRFEKTH